MVEVEITPRTLILHVLGMDKVLALKSRIELPLGQIKSAMVGIEAAALVQVESSVRMPGTSIPGIIRAGSYYDFRRKEWMFWDVHSGDNAISLLVDQGKYRKIIVEVQDPVRTVADICASLAGLG